MVSLIRIPDLNPLPWAKGKADARCQLGRGVPNRTRFPLLLERGEDKGEESTNDKSITKGNVHVTGSLDELAIRRNQLQTIDRLSNRHMAHLIILITHH